MRLCDLLSGPLNASSHSVYPDRGEHYRGPLCAALFGLLVLHFLGRDHRWWIAFLINFLPFYFLPLFAIIVVALLGHARFALVVTVPLRSSV